MTFTRWEVLQNRDLLKSIYFTIYFSFTPGKVLYWQNYHCSILPLKKFKINVSLCPAVKHLLLTPCRSISSLCVCLCVSVVSPRQCLDSEDDLQQLQSDGVPSEVTDWLASTFTQRVRRPVRRSDEKPKFRSIVHAVQAGIFVERCDNTFARYIIFWI